MYCFYSQDYKRLIKKRVIDVERGEGEEKRGERGERKGGEDKYQPTGRRQALTSDQQAHHITAFRHPQTRECVCVRQQRRAESSELIKHGFFSLFSVLSCSSFLLPVAVAVDDRRTFWNI